MFSALITRIKEELAYQRDLAEMASMDDRQLADIGVTRFDLAVALRQGRRDGASRGAASRSSQLGHQTA